MKVRKEVSKPPCDQLDLLLESKIHVLVIENNIHAEEQYRQLAYYIEYVESKKSKIRQVFYLILGGKQAMTDEGGDYL